MQTKEIIKLWKEIIYISGFYKNYDSLNKEKIIKKLLYYKEKLEWGDNSYSKKLLDFISDLLADLDSNKPLQIDNLFEDDYVWNFYDAYKQAKIYNSLINKENYLKIFENKKDNNILFLEFYENFIKYYSKLDFDLISKNYLIFTTFEIKTAKKYFSRLYFFRKKLNFSYENILKLKKIIYLYEDFLKKLYNKSILNLKNKSFNYKYIKINKISSQDDFELNFNLLDASKYDFRSWNPVFEYKELLKKLKKEI